MENSNKRENFIPVENIDFKKLIDVFVSRWYIIAATLIISLSIAYVYLRYTPRIYQTRATIKIETKQKEIPELFGGSGNLSFFENMTKVQAEIQILKSKKIITEASKILDYPIAFFVSGRVITVEEYPDKPLFIEIIQTDTTKNKSPLFEFTLIDNNQFKLKLENVNETYTFNLGDTISIRNYIFKINSVKSYERQILFQFQSPSSLYGRVARNLEVTEVEKNTPILSIRLKDTDPDFARDFINSLIQAYINYDLEQKTLSSGKTLDFINEQIERLESSVNVSGQALQSFKQRNEVLNIESSVQASSARMTALETQLNLLRIQSIAIENLERQLSDNVGTISFDLSIDGQTDPLLTNQIGQLNTLLNERIRLLTQYEPTSQPVRLIDNQIVLAKQAISGTIRAQKNRNVQTIRFLERELSSERGKLKQIPSAERDFLVLQNDFDVNQNIFTFLSEKKLETSIAKAGTLPAASILDIAELNNSAISPRVQYVYLVSLFIGLGFGIAIILLIRIFNSKIRDISEIEFNTNVSIIGLVRQFPYKLDENSSQVLALANPKSVFTESIRSVRTNLSFLATENKSKVICINSEVSGEGKSFMSINIAGTLSLIDKRVVLIACDLRRSKMHKTFGSPNTKGVSTYLTGKDSLEKIIEKTDYENLDFIPSGPFPPNPSELLYLPKLDELISELKSKYDYIIFDTAPIGLVSDSIPLIRKSDINIFVLRSGVSSKSAVYMPERLLQEHNLKNVGIILNAYVPDALYNKYYTSSEKYGYYSNIYGGYSNYSYTKSGYYTNEDVEKKPWWNFWSKN